MSWASWRQVIAPESRERWLAFIAREGRSMQPDMTTRPRPAGTGSRPQGFTAGNPHQKSRRLDGWTSTPPRRRCPWYADVVRFAAGPVWHDCALLFAGRHAWEAAATRRGNRAVTVLPPGSDPASIAWPAIGCWIVDAGDLPASIALDLARALIDAGALRVHASGQNLLPSLCMRAGA